MKQWLVLSLTCLLTSSCGLFKKTIKTSNTTEQIEKIEVKSQTNEDLKAELKGETFIKSAEQKQVLKNIDERTTLTANEIEVMPDGSIKGKGDARLQHNKKDKGISNENKAVERNDQYEGHIDVKTENKDQQKRETKVKTNQSASQSEPKGSMMIWGGLGILIVIIGLLLFFGFRPKKPSVENKTTG